MSKSLLLILLLLSIAASVASGYDDGYIDESECPFGNDSAVEIDYSVNVELFHGIDISEMEDCHEEDFERMVHILNTTMANNDALHQMFRMLELNNDRLCVDETNSRRERRSLRVSGQFVYLYVFRGGGICRFCAGENQDFNSRRAKELLIEPSLSSLDSLSPSETTEFPNGSSTSTSKATYISPARRQALMASASMQDHPNGRVHGVIRGTGSRTGRSAHADNVMNTDENYNKQRHRVLKSKGKGTGKGKGKGKGDTPSPTQAPTPRPTNPSTDPPASDRGDEGPGGSGSDPYAWLKARLPAVQIILRQDIERNLLEWGQTNEKSCLTEATRQDLAVNVQIFLEASHTKADLCFSNN